MSSENISSHTVGPNLVRVSSFENTLKGLGEIANPELDKESATHVIQAWWRKLKGIRNVLQKLKEDYADVNALQENLSNLPNNLRSAQTFLSENKFQSILGKFLQCIPRDPSLGSKNPQAKSVKTVIIAVLIRQFPGDILQTERLIEDMGQEAMNCRVAANLLFISLIKLLKQILQSFNKRNELSTFRKYFVAYRFSMRNFIDKLEIWRKLDKTRMLEAMNNYFIEAYTIFTTTTESLRMIRSQTYLDGVPEEIVNEIDNFESIIEQTRVRLSQAETMIKDTLKETRKQYTSIDLEEYIQSLKNRVHEKLSNATPVTAQVSDSEDVLPATSLTVATQENTSPQTQGPLESNQREEIAANTPSSAPPPTTTSSSPSSHVLGAQQSPQPATGLVDTGFLTTQQQTYLSKVLSITSIDLEYLLYEITLNPTFQLPNPNISETDSSPLSSSSSSTPSLASSPEPYILSSTTTASEERLQMKNLIPVLATNPALGAKMLKRHMLRLLSDRLVNSLRPSPIQHIEQVRVGAVVPIKYSDSSIGSATTSPTLQIYSAKVLSVDVANPRIDVEFLSDGIVQKQLPFPHVKLTSDPVDASPLLEALADLKKRLAELTPHRSDLISQLDASLDLQLLKQMLERQVMSLEDLQRMVLYLFDYIQNLQSPIQLESTIRWRSAFESLCQQYITSSQSPRDAFNEAILLLPSFFEFIHDNIDEIFREMANYYISLLAPTLASKAFPVISQLLLERVSLKKLTLDKTSSWLRGQIGDEQGRQGVISELSDAGLRLSFDDRSVTIIPTGGAATPNSDSISQSQQQHLSWEVSVLARAVVHLLRIPVRLDSIDAVISGVLPETLSWDATRLAHIRDEMDVLVLQTSMLIVAKQILAGGISGSYVITADESEELFFRLDVLLRDPGVFLGHLTAEMSRFVRSKVMDATVTGNSVVGQPQGLQPGWEVRLEEAVKSAVSEGHQVLSLLSKRVQRLVLLGMLGLPYEQLLPGYSMTSKPQQKSLQRIIGLTARLFRHNFMVYGRIYSTVLQQILES